MILQRSSELAIRAALFLAQQAPGKLSPVHEIAAYTGVSEAYLAKILQRLAGAGLVRSFRGPGKGMELGRAPGSISLDSIVCAMEGPWGKTIACSASGFVRRRLLAPCTRIGFRFVPRSKHFYKTPLSPIWLRLPKANQTSPSSR